MESLPIVLGHLEMARGVMDELTGAAPQVATVPEREKTSPGCSGGGCHILENDPNLSGQLFALHDLMTFAGASFQSRPIEYRDLPSAIFNRTFPL